MKQKFIKVRCTECGNQEWFDEGMNCELSEKRSICCRARLIRLEGEETCV